MYKVKWLLGICILYMLGVLGLIVYAIITPATTTTSTSTGIVSTNAVSSTPSQTTSTTSQNFNDVNSGSSTSANGLSFSVSTDLTTYTPGQGVEVVVDEKNTLSKTNNVPVSDNWPLKGLTGMYFGPYIYPNIPYGISVYQGDYTSADFAISTPLFLYDPTPTYLEITVNAPTSYAFEPSSDVANIIPADAGIGIQQISDEMTLKGYWTNSPVSSFSYFDPGVYTVVAGDEWGAVVLVHFTITN
jgi:hypothetical protein